MLKDICFYNSVPSEVVTMQSLSIWAHASLHSLCCLMMNRNKSFNPVTGNAFTTVFGNRGGVILPPVVFRLYCPYLKNSNGATYIIKGAKFSSVVGNYVSVQLNRKFLTISGLIAILKFVCSCSALSAI